jgi:hypothetical protein
MRKLVAVTMVALLALTLALVVVGCAKKTDESSTPAETSMPPAETAMPESTMADTSMGH